MNITPVIPDGYNGPIKQLTCRICKHLFYLTMADYDRLTEVSYCHECSLLLLEELERNYESGNALITLERDVEAFEAFARSIELDPLNLDVYERVGTLHFIRGNHEKSLAIYSQALQIFFDCTKLHEKRAGALVHLNRYQEALDACNRALQLDDSSASAYSEKGEILHQLRRFNASEQKVIAGGLSTAHPQKR